MGNILQFRVFILAETYLQKEPPKPFYFVLSINHLQTLKVRSMNIFSNHWLMAKTNLDISLMINTDKHSKIRLELSSDF